MPTIRERLRRAELSQGPDLMAFALICLATLVGPTFEARAAVIRATPIDVVRAVMATPDDQIDIAKAKLTFDKLYDPSVDIASALRQIDDMAGTIRRMAGPSAPSRLRLAMLRRYVYDAGPWNDGKPFAYDMSDPLGHKPGNRLLTAYLRTHRGNCVSMPVLFIALAERLGLKATLSTAPDHIFVRYFDDVTGQTFDLEATSGAHTARDAWIRQNMPMTDAAIANGIYMKTLRKKEAIVVLAEIVIERALADRHFQDAWDITEALRPYYPNNLVVLLTPSNAAQGLVQEEFLAKYRTKADIPPERLARLDFLETTVTAALNNAYALGWRESDGETLAAHAAR